MTTTMSTPSVRTTAWHALHLWTDGTRDDVDRLLLDHVAPAVDALEQEGRLTRWFFIRYSEGGQHLRVRLGDADQDAVDALCARWAGVPGVRVTREVYEPEVERYGGPAGLPAAEELFCTSTQLVLAALRRAPGSAHRMAAAVEFVLATARGLGLDASTAAAWLRSNAYSWRWHLGEPGATSTSSLQDAAVAAARTRRGAVDRRFAELAGTVDLAAASPTVRNRWALAVHEAVTADAPAASRARVLGVWASQVHMTLNRLGVAPEEERWLDWMIAACLQAPARTDEYFSASPQAPDRSYLVASRYALPDMPLQAPEDVVAPEPLFDWSPFAGTVLDLPAGSPPAVDLWSALRERRSGRGPYAPLTAADLATLLWHSTRPEGGRGAGRHAHPSAGGQFPVRMRLAVRDVDGVRPGLYEADPVARGLVRMGHCPSSVDLATTSMWFRERPPFDDRIDTTTVPVVIGLYLDLAPIRARYGQRALRFALLEAGHVAQNLALVAAATGSELCTVGGFYDDVAHDVFLLDGVDRVLAYLLPVGAPAVTRAVTAVTP